VSDQYVFKPKPEVADWIDENIDSWTGFCYENIAVKQRKQYIERLDKTAQRVFYVIIGMIIVSFSYLSVDIVNYMFLIAGGLSVIIYGLFSLGYEVVLNGRRRRRI